MKDLKQIEQYTSYSKYKDSRIDWIGEVPEHWEIKPLFAYMKKKQLKNVNNIEQNVLSLSYGKIVRRDVESNFGLLPESFETYQIVEPGNIILRLTDLQNDKRSLRVGLVKERGIITSAYLCLQITTEELNSEYTYYLLHTYDLKKVFYNLGSGVRQSLKYDELKRMPLLIPPLKEQETIAEFLDFKTSQIDSIIKDKERLIEHLKEYRQAIITEAVTKGLSPETTKMKDSGVDGIGEIPKHWTIERLKYFVKMIGGGTPSKENKDFWDGEIPWVSPKDMKSDFIETTEDKITWEGLKNSSTTLIEREAVLVVIRSGILKHSLPVAINKIPVTLNQDMKALISQRYVKTEYLAWLLKGLSAHILFNCKKIGATVDSIEIEYLNMLQVPIPPMEEQISIIKYLKKHTESINNLIKEVNYQIEKLCEYRESLICEAVTGKIDVRGFRKGE